MSSNLDYYKINKIIFFKSGRFDINLDDGILIKYPIRINLNMKLNIEYLVNHFYLNQIKQLL